MKSSRLLGRALALGVATAAVCALHADTRTATSTPASQPAPILAPRQHAPIHIHERLSRGEVTSTNWSGYAVTGTNVTTVNGSWTVPEVTCPKATRGKTTAQYSSFWVGIDGFNSSSVEQIGTDSDCTSKGTPSYYAWYEFYPNPAYLIGNVRVGDTIQASVVKDDQGFFNVTITDTPVVGTPYTYQTRQSVPKAQQSSAEWIAEAPSGVGGILPLANFKMVSFGTSGMGSDNAVIGGTPGPLGSFADPQSITMVSKRSHLIKAVPTTPLDSDQSGFDVTWVSAGP